MRSEAALAEALAAKATAQAVEIAWHLYHQRLRLLLREAEVPTDQADDLLQELFTGLLLEVGHLNAASLYSWLLAGAVFAIRSWRLNQHRAAERQEAAWAAHDPRNPLDTHQAVLHREDLRQVFSAVKTLSDLDLLLFESLLVEGDSHRELNARLAEQGRPTLNPAAVSNRKRRLRDWAASALGSTTPLPRRVRS